MRFAIVNDRFVLYRRNEAAFPPNSCTLPYKKYITTLYINYQVVYLNKNSMQKPWEGGGGQKGPFYLWTRQKATFPPVSFLFSSKQYKTTYIPTLKWPASQETTKQSSKSFTSSKNGRFLCRKGRSPCFLPFLFCFTWKWIEEHIYQISSQLGDPLYVNKLRYGPPTDDGM
jgi:hypothetical protein